MISKNNGILLFISIIIVYIIGLFTDITGDAAKYATISRGMLETGNFFELKIVDGPYLQKPPLHFWLVILSFKIFGLTNYAYKLPTLLITMVGIYSAFKFASFYYGKRVGMLASVMLATTQIYFFYNNDVHTDAMLTAFVIFSIWQLCLYLNTKKTINFILGFVGVGLTMMAKGPVGAFVVVFAVGTHLLLRKDFKRIFDWHWIVGLLIALIIVSPAIYSLYKQFGREGITFFFWSNNTGRIASGNHSSSSNDWFFYLHTIAWAVLPWTALMFYGIFKEFQDIFRKEKKEYFLTGGFILYFVIVTIAKFKSPNYIMVVIPLVSIIAAKWADDFMNTSTQKQQNVMSSIQIVVSIILWILLLTLLVLVFPTKSIVIWGLFVIAFLGTIILFYTSGKELNFKIYILPLLSILVLNLILNFYVFPTIFSYQGAIKAANIINEKRVEGEKVHNYIYDHYEMFFYSEESVTQIYSPEELQTVLEQKNSWLFTNQQGLDEIKKTRNVFRELYEIDHKSLTRTGIKFFNPKTRQNTFKKMYLIRL